MKKFGAIFDMDGTLIDNNAYHFEAWKAVFEKYKHMPVSFELYNEKMSGVPGMTVMREFFPEYTEDEMQRVFEEKSQTYKDAFAPFAAPINGLERLLMEFKNAGIKMAIASSATVANINFILEHVPIRQYFDAIVDGPRISKPKPNTQIFLKAAEDLGIKPEDCIVFEDSISGIKAGRAAGMKVVAITSTHSAQELPPSDLAVTDYTGLSLQKLAALFEEN
ncbi:HAD family phosphatase [Mucilaginibacter sp. Bleaf8]|uniref:HAD family hydrolase n=1 Tax=Mucilaginibacter sp. Bleaf8 TaxID=2834430 RepID=UPI001BCB4872|nr:HAD family phosphatase [Mucilaginibacter sp. Bleaf8]MBS7564291.1 HAD family phosphatase [Mucilaginibacter sp. Bleaf8]